MLIRFEFSLNLVHSSIFTNIQNHCLKGNQATEKKQFGFVFSKAIDLFIRLLIYHYLSSNIKY